MAGRRVSALGKFSVLDNTLVKVTVRRTPNPGKCQSEGMMDNARECRNKAPLCRQQATLHPEQNWKWLAQAERWEHLAEAPLTLKETTKYLNLPTEPRERAAKLS